MQSENTSTSRGSTTVNTNSLDHPRALANYQRVGCAVARKVEHSFDDPRLKGLI